MVRRYQAGIAESLSTLEVVAGVLRSGLLTVGAVEIYWEHPRGGAGPAPGGPSRYTGPSTHVEPWTWSGSQDDTGEGAVARLCSEPGRVAAIVAELTGLTVVRRALQAAGGLLSLRGHRAVHQDAFDVTPAEAVP